MCGEEIPARSLHTCLIECPVTHQPFKNLEHLCLSIMMKNCHLVLRIYDETTLYVSGIKITNLEHRSVAKIQRTTKSDGGWSCGHHVQTTYFVASMWKDHLNIGRTILQTTMISPAEHQVFVSYSHPCVYMYQYLYLPKYTSMVGLKI